MHCGKIINAVIPFWILLFGIWSGCGPKEATAPKQLYNNQTTFFSTLNMADTLNITITTDFESIFENKKLPDKYYQEAFVEAYDGGETIFSQEIDPSGPLFCNVKRSKAFQ